MDRFDLGRHRRPVSTKSDRAQFWFDMGLNWCYGFNQEEGVKCFLRALEHDPGCVMAHWGAAYGQGPFYNNTWRQHLKAEADATAAFCTGHIEAARAAADRATPLENGLVEALARRFQKPHSATGAEYDQWDEDYAAAMRRVYHAHPGDLDVAALFAEAIMTRTPWKLWNQQTGLPPADADTFEALAVLEHAIARCDADGMPHHPAILHLHIHATEMSKQPERALRSADMLGTLCPDAGHMNHMPAHTYVLCGLYEKAKAASEKAIRADEMYLNYAGPCNFYTTARCHDLHMMMHSCMMMGQFTPAWAAACRIRETLGPDVLMYKGPCQTAATMEGYYAMAPHVLVRFGRWQQIIDMPLPDDPVLYPVAIPMQHYARVVAHAALKQFDRAEAALTAFYDSRKRIPEERTFFNNDARAILAVGESMALGELDYHRGNHAAAYDHLREAVRRNDALAYSEPWPWMHPPRHALAALLAEQGHFDEAEQVCRDDLGLSDAVPRCAQHSGNIWALHGFVECLRARGDTAERPEFEARLARAMTLTDVPVTSACMCRAASGCC